VNEITVGVRELRSRLSEYLRRVKAGETLVITEHGQTIGRIVPAAASLDERLKVMVEAGLAEWNGQRVPEAHPSVSARGKRTVADLLIEDRA
jgi:prevent-host-death family protein